jgi:hypothetical protein
MTEVDPVAQERAMPRRTFLLIGGLSVVGLAAAGLLGEKILDNHERADQAHNQEIDNDNSSAKVFAEGLSSNWQFATVWPGVAIIPSAVKLFSTPELNPSTEVEWPTDKSQRHLIAQRPFMAKGTAGANLVDAYGDRFGANFGSEVLAFWMPHSDDLVYCDRAANSGNILLASNSTDKIWTNNYSGIVGEGVLLEPTLRSGGLTYRYVEDQIVQLNFNTGENEHVTQKKVVGRSVWADPAQASQAYYDYTEDYGNDIIQLPKRTH